ISSPSLGRAGADLGLDLLTMSGLVPDLFNSKPILAGCAASWRACAVSPWVLRTITAGYELQFAPSFGGVIQSVVQQGQSHFLQKEIDSLLQKEAISVVPPEEGEGRELSANTRSSCVEQSAHAVEVQNADSKTNLLVHHDRPKRCLLPCPDPPQTSEISEVCVRRNSMPVPRTPVRPGSGTEGFQKVRGSSHHPITTTRFAFIQLFGRLARLCSFKSSSGARLPSSGGTSAPTTLRNKQGKKRSAPRPDHAFPRHGSRLHLHGGQAVPRLNKCHQIMRASVPARTV